MRMRFGNAHIPGTQRHVEQTGDADSREVGVAIGESRQTIPRTQSVQSGPNVYVQFHLVARSEEDFECPLGNPLFVTAIARVPRKRSNPQVGEVMRFVGLGQRQSGARLTHLLDCDALRDSRTVLPKPLHQEGFGAGDHRTNLPESIIEVERNGADFRMHDCLKLERSRF